ncbi:hypothetical protein HOF92_14280, partial [bacterium]|nr:hypothetical protein [bacterium]
IFFILMSFLVSNSICYAQTFPSNSPETAEIPSIEEKERIQFFESLSEEDALKVDKLLDYIHLSSRRIEPCIHNRFNCEKALEVTTKNLRLKIPPRFMGKDGLETLRVNRARTLLQHGKVLTMSGKAREGVGFLEEALLRINKFKGPESEEIKHITEEFLIRIYEKTGNKVKLEMLMDERFGRSQDGISDFFE